MKHKTKIYSIFGECDAAVAEEMAAEGKINRIEQHLIPPTALYDAHGNKAKFAIVMPDLYAGEYMDRVWKLRA